MISLYRMVKVRSDAGEKALQEGGWENTEQYIEDAQNGYLNGAITRVDILDAFVTDAGFNNDSAIEVQDLDGLETEIVKGISNIATTFYTKDIKVYKIDGKLWATEEDYTNAFC